MSEEVEQVSSSTESLPKPTFFEGEVDRELGRGGCGVVVSVLNVEDEREGRPPRMAALKAETIDPKGKVSQTIKVEAFVLRRLQNSRHFCKLYLACRIDESVNIMVMSLVGRSLSWLRRHCPNQHFTLSTALRIQAIEELHRRGFLHRDVKGSNFAVGVGLANQRIIHIDIVTRGQLMEEEGQLKMRPARKRAPFLGTDRYCSVNVHRRGEHGRVDDLWSFLFMLVEFIKGKLPWKDIDENKLAKAKEYYIDTLLENCPLEMWEVLRHLRTLKFDSRPNYDLIRHVFKEICVRCNFNEADPYDWEVGGAHFVRILKSEAEKQRRSLQKSPESEEIQDE